MPPTVSINLCCYNSEKYLQATLQSIFAQTFTDWELIIINDGSTDSTEQIIRQCMQAGYPIRYHAQENQGLGFSRNKAIELSAGKFVALIDHDDLWLPEKLAQQVPLFERPEVALVYSDAYMIDADGRNLGFYSEMWRYQFRRGQVLPSLFLNDFIACSTVLLRRRVLDTVGVFNPTLKIAEEYDLFVRIASLYEFDFVSSPLMKWRLHADNSSWNIALTQEEERGLLNVCLEQNPQLKDDLGPAAIRIRLSGFTCKPDQAALLKGRWAEVRATHPHLGTFLKSLANLLTKYVISFLPYRLTKLLMRAWRMRRYVKLL